MPPNPAAMRTSQLSAALRVNSNGTYVTSTETAHIPAAGPSDTPPKPSSKKTEIGGEGTADSTSRIAGPETFPNPFASLATKKGRWNLLSRKIALRLHHGWDHPNGSGRPPRQTR